MKRPLFASLRVRLWLLLILAFTPILLLILYSAAEQRRHALRDIQGQALQLAQVVSSDQERLVDGIRQLLVALAHVPDIRDDNPEACHQFLSSLLKDDPLYANFGVADRRGDIICSAVPLDGAVYIADRSYFVGALVAQDFAIGEFQVGRVTGRATINFGYPILDEDGRPQAVVFAAVDLSWLNRLVAAVDLPAKASLVVIDRGGVILARHPHPQTWVGRSEPGNPLFQAVLAQGKGTAEMSGLDGVPRIYAFTSFRGLPEAGYVVIGIPQAVAYAPARWTLTRNLICLAVVAALAFGTAWLGADALLVRHVRALLGATKKLSTGDLSARTGLPPGPGELQQLAAAFDEMAASIEKHATQQRLEDDLRRHNEALEAENRRVRELTQLKSEFVLLVSHELRTPLTAISGYLDLLLEESGGDPARLRHLLNIVKRNTARLVKLLDDLLDLSHIESGKVELNLSPLDLLGVIDEVVGLLHAQIEAKGQQLTIEHAEAIPQVLGDAERIRQILINLLSNAHKYTPPQGHIWVTAHRLEGWVRVDIRDDGQGLSVAEQAQIFNKFFRAPQAAEQEVDGAGLGLAITRLLVEMHGGQITVASTPDQGSTFSFTLPTAVRPYLP